MQGPEQVTSTEPGTAGDTGRSQEKRGSHAAMVWLPQTIDGEATFRKFTESCKNMTTLMGKIAKLCNLEQNAPFRPHSDVQLLAVPKVAAGKKIIKRKLGWGGAHMAKGREVEKEP